MVNTYGIHSINPHSFNQRCDEKKTFPRKVRNVIITGFRIHNVVLDVLGYIPATSTVSGCVRMTTGLALIGFTLAFGERNASPGAIIGRWYDEAIATGITQIARGALEAFISFGRIANLILDIIATPFNRSKLEAESRVGMNDKHADAVCQSHPHPDVNYPLPFQFLKLV